MPNEKKPSGASPEAGLTPDQIEPLLAAYGTKNWSGAMAGANALLRSHPEVPLLHNLKGAILAATGKVDDAVASYLKAIELKDDYADAHSNFGVLLHTLGRLDESLSHLRKAIAARPNFAPAHFNLGNTLRELGKIAEAKDSYLRAIAIDPNYIDALNNIGAMLSATGAPESAVPFFNAALAINPKNVQSHYNLGNAFQKLGDLDEAIESWEKALNLHPSFVEAHNNIALAYGKKGDHNAAIRHLTHAIEIQPQNFASYKNIGAAYQNTRDYKRALDSYKTALSLDAENTDVLIQAVHCAHHLCEWTDIKNLERRRDQALTKHIGTSPPFALIAHCSDLDLQLQAAKSYCNHIAPIPARPLFNSSHAANSKIRLAYVSADFHEHATAYLMAHMFELHDKNNFEVIAISTGPNDHSPMRRRLEAAFDVFVDSSQMKDREIAQLIADKNVDIAIDLKGHTQGERFGVFAYRPTPIQVAYLGYPGTTGSPFIDYLIGDSVVTPPEHQQYYSEKLVQLPGCYQVNDATRSASEMPTRHDCGLPDTGFVFCVFNSHYKIEPDVFAIWLRLLAAVPGSVLWFVDERPTSRDNLRATASAAGVDPTRLVFARKVSQAAHLARIGCADIFLDTTPYGAHTTASDALWMGVPVLTMLGKTFASRVAASQLRTLNMPELVTSSLEQYEELALTLARHPGRLRALKEQLKSNAATSDLFNTDVFRGRLEDAFTKMLEHYRRGQPVASFVMDDH